MRKLLEIIELRFASLNDRNIYLIERCDESELYKKPSAFDGTFIAVSVGELVLRSTACVEQTFGGITAKLWDDPFEWTLPEQLSTRSKLLDHIKEVDELRTRGFEFFTDDGSLFKTIPAPETIKTIAELLLQTLAVAENYNGQAAVIFSLNERN